MNVIICYIHMCINVVIYWSVAYILCINNRYQEVSLHTFTENVLALSFSSSFVVVPALLVIRKQVVVLKHGFSVPVSMWVWVWRWGLGGCSCNCSCNWVTSYCSLFIFCIVLSTPDIVCNVIFMSVQFQPCKSVDVYPILLFITWLKIFITGLSFSPPLATCKDNMRIQSHHRPSVGLLLC